MISHKQIDQINDIIKAQNIAVPLVAVYCGSRMGNNPIYEKTAFELGEKLAKSGLGVVYGGASIGIMGAVADGVLSQAGVVVGVMPEFMQSKRQEIAHANLTKLHFTDSMHTRKAVMASYASGFIALSGGFGTLEEIAEIITWRQLQHHNKPMILLNTNGFYQHLIAHIACMVNEGFMPKQDAENVIICQSPDEVIDYLTKTFAKSATVTEIQPQVF